MSARWRYYTPSGMNGLLPPILDTDELVSVGARELEILLRARHSTAKRVVVGHSRADNAMRLAARRLTLRGLLHPAQRFGNDRNGRIHVYRLTERGRTCWLRATR